MTTSADDLRARVRQLNFPTADEGSGGGPASFNPSPNSSLSGRGPRPRPSLGLSGVGNSFAMGSPTARRPTPDTLNLGVSYPAGCFSSVLVMHYTESSVAGAIAEGSTKLHWNVRPAAAQPGSV